MLIITRRKTSVIQFSSELNSLFYDLRDSCISFFRTSSASVTARLRSNSC